MEYLKMNFNFQIKVFFLDASKNSPVEKVFPKGLQDGFLRLIYAIPHGVSEMSQAVEGLVETSTNMAIVEIKDNTIELLTSQRSSVASAIIDIAGKVRAVGELAGFKIEEGGGYPAWEPNPDSALLKFATAAYKDTTGDEAEVKAIHAGLECGIIGEKYDGMDMISFGPDIEGAHSPDERVHMQSVNNCWEFLVELLKKI